MIVFDRARSSFGSRHQFLTVAYEIVARLWLGVPRRRRQACGPAAPLRPEVLSRIAVFTHGDHSALLDLLNVNVPVLHVKDSLRAPTPDGGRPAAESMPEVRRDVKISPPSHRFEISAQGKEGAPSTSPPFHVFRVDYLSTLH